MFNHVSNVYVFVNDQERAKAFYTEKLGMEVRMEMPDTDGDHGKWITVAPHGATTEIVLMNFNPMWEHYRAIIGKVQAMQFAISNVTSLIAELKAKGVEVVQEPNSQPWGTSAIIKDSEGNDLFLFEAASY